MKISQISPRRIAITTLFLIASFIFLCLASCVTQKQRARICNTCSVVSNSKDSIIETVVHDTIKLPPIYGPVQYLENPCKKLCDSLGNLIPFVIKEKKNGITGTIKSVGNSIAFDCAADSLQAYIEYIKKESYHKKEENHVKYIPCENERTRFDGFTFWWFWITGIILFLYILIRIVKTYFKAYFPFLK